MLKLLRKVFRRKSKKKSHSKDKSPENSRKTDQSSTDTKPDEEKIVVSNDLYESVEYRRDVTSSNEKSDKSDGYSHSQISERVLRQIGIYDDFQNENFYDIADHPTFIRDIAEATVHIPRANYPGEYHHLMGFPTKGKDKGEYDKLMRDNYFPTYLRRRSQSVMDIRDNNNYILKMRNPAIKPVEADNEKASLNSDAERKKSARSPTSNRFHYQPFMRRDVGDKSLTLGGQRNASRIYGGSRTIGRPVIPLEPKFKHVALERSYVRDIYSSRNIVRRAESQISRNHVNALRAQFDQRANSRDDTLPRKKKPLSVATKPTRTASEQTDDLAESSLFNTMKQRFNSTG